jgi:hypothetical protein
MKLSEERRTQIIEETQKTGKMNLFPEELKEEAKNFPLYSQDGKMEKAKVLVKYFNPQGVGEWIAIEGSQEGEDFTFFGFCCLSEWEYGYFTLNQLKELQDKGIPIEIDLYTTGETLEDFLRINGEWENYKETFLKDDEEEKEED